MSSAHIRRDPPKVTVVASSVPVVVPPSVADQFPGITITPLFDDATLDRLDALTSRAAQFSPNYQAPDWRLWHRVHLPAAADWDSVPPSAETAEFVRNSLLADLPVTSVTVETAVVPPPLADGTSETSKDAKTLDPAPVGVGVEAVWESPGGRGQDEVLGIVERGWHRDHAEWKGEVTFVEAGGLDEPDWVPHGTKTLSVTVARENDAYSMGVAPETPKVVLSAEQQAADEDPDTEQALVNAISALAEQPVGSVLLLETQKKAHDYDSTVADEKLEGPCEMNAELFALIQLAVANHIVVVEAAGNGGTADAGIGAGLDLDDHPALIHGDSGAIMVGQSMWSEDDGHVAVPYGCTGQRIDCFGWGADVPVASAQEFGVTKEGAPAFEDTDGTYSGTSAASALVAGCALVVQGLVRNGGADPIGYLPPTQMRSVLRDRTDGVNTWLDDDKTDVIGVMPNLANIATELGVLPDLYIRDNLSDTGGEHSGTLCRSPDIILRTGPIGGSPDDVFGEGSGTESDEELSETPEEGDTDVAVYVRLRNRGGSDVVDATVTVHYTKPSSYGDPGAWELVGSTKVDVPAGDTFVVTKAIPFAIPDPGHYCLIATVDHPQDPLFVPDASDPPWSFSEFVRLSNNVAWRNFNVVEVPDEGTSFTAYVSGASGGAEAEDAMDVAVETRLPRGALIELEVAETMRGRLPVPPGAWDGCGRLRLRAAGALRLDGVRLRKKERCPVTFRVRLPKSTSTRARHEVSLVQRYRGRVVGRVTWSLRRAPAEAPPKSGAAPSA